MNRNLKSLGTFRRRDAYNLKVKFNRSKENFHDLSIIKIKLKNFCLNIIRLKIQE